MVLVVQIEGRVLNQYANGIEWNEIEYIRNPYSKRSIEGWIDR